MASKRMVTPPDLCPRTLRWLAEEQERRWRSLCRAAANCEPRQHAAYYVSRADYALDLRRLYRARASRIEAKQKQRGR